MAIADMACVYSRFCTQDGGFACESRRMRLLKRTGLFDENTEGISIKRATTLDELHNAYRLVHDLFVMQGYIKANPCGLRIRAYEALPKTATFTANHGDEIIGVLSVVIDSRDMGLPSDHTFSDEINDLRRNGRKVCEGTNWAIVEEYRNSGVLTELMRCALAQAVEEGRDDFVGAISPNHFPFFRLLGFDKIGSTRNYSQGIYDPVTLVCLDVAGMGERFEDVRSFDGDDEAFLKEYYLDSNPYHRYVPAWSNIAERFFSEEALLREFFFHRSRLLSHCTQSEIEAIRYAWGKDMFARVMFPRRNVGF